MDRFAERLGTRDLRTDMDMDTRKSQIGVLFGIGKKFERRRHFNAELVFLGTRRDVMVRVRFNIGVKPKGDLLDFF